MAVGTPVLRSDTVSWVDVSTDQTLTLGQALTAGNMAFCIFCNSRDDSANPSAATSVTGGGVTWTLDKTYAFDAAGTQRSSIFVYRALASAPSGTSIVIDLAETSAGCACVVEVPGCAISGTNGADAIHATNVGQATGTANLVAATMPGTGLATSALLAIAMCSNGTAARTWTPDSSPAMTEIADFATAVSAAAKYRSISVSYGLGVVDVTPVVGATTSASIDTNGILVLNLLAPVTANADNHAALRGFTRGLTRGFA